MLFTIVQEVIEIPEAAYKQNTVYRPWPADADFGNRHNTSLKATPGSYATATARALAENPYDAVDSRFAAIAIANIAS